MKKGAHVSVILVNYNGLKDTLDCLNSLRRVNYSDFDVIIVDNASADDSAARLGSVLQKHETLIESQFNNGFSAGNNIGIKYALEHGADYCLLLNNDTLVEPDFLTELILPFETYDDCGLTIGKILYASQPEIIWYAGGSVDFSTARTRHWHYRERDDIEKNEITDVSFATGCCMCLSAKAINTIGYLNEEYFMYVEDVEYCMKLQKAGYRLLYNPNSRIYHKVNASSGNSSFSQYYSVRNKLLLIQQNFEKPQKWKAFSYIFIQSLWRGIKKEYDLPTVIKAFKAFRKGEVGKSTLV